MKYLLVSLLLAGCCPALPKSSKLAVAAERTRTSFSPVSRVELPDAVCYIYNTHGISCFPKPVTNGK